MFAHHKTLITLLTTLTLLSACSSTPTTQQLAKEQLKIEKHRQEVAQKQAENTLDAMPSWAASVPRPDSTGVYALGMADSDKMPIALKKAHLQAEYGLAKQINQELAGSERSMQHDAGTQSSSQYQSLIQSLVTYVPVVGFEVVQQDVKAVNGQFQAYILLKLPYAELNKTLQNQKQNTQQASMRQAFNELELRLQQRQHDKTQQP